jgi:hypothetical protein
MDIDTTDSRPALDNDTLSLELTSTNGTTFGGVSLSTIPHHLVDNNCPDLSKERTGSPICHHVFLDMRSDAMMDDDHVHSANASPSQMPDILTNGEMPWWRRRGLPSPTSEDRDIGTSFVDTFKIHNKVCSNSSRLHRERAPAELSPMRSQQGEWLAESEMRVAAFAGDRKIREVSTRAVVMQKSPSPYPSDASDYQNKQPLVKTPVASGKRKISLLMGYRADCEKCRLKVQGHYSHLIYS